MFLVLSSSLPSPISKNKLIKSVFLNVTSYEIFYQLPQEKFILLHIALQYTCLHAAFAFHTMSSS